MNYYILLRIPLYKQIQQSIRNAISSDELENNVALPFEEEIAEFYIVSRIALCMAYEALANESLIVRMKRLIESLGYTYSQHNLLIKTIKSDYAQFLEILKPIRIETSEITAVAVMTATLFTLY